MKRVGDRTQLRFLLGLLALSLLLRVLYVVCMPAEITSGRDAAHYTAIASNVADALSYSDSVGQWRDEPFYSDVGPTSFWLPAYPLFLAVVFVAVGPSPAGIFLAQAVLGTVSVLLCYACARLLLTPRSALLAAAIFGASAYQLYQVRIVGTEVLSAFVMLLILWSALRVQRAIEGRVAPSLTSILVLAFALSLGLLTRAAFAAVALGVLLLLGWLHWTRRRTPSADDAARKTGERLVLLCLLVVIGISPWIVRNRVVWGKWVYQTKSGVNMAIGFSDRATGAFTLDGVSRLDPARTNETSRNEALTKGALAWIRAHPGKAAWLFAKKILLLYNPVPSTVVGPGKWLLAAWNLLFLGLAALGAVYALGNSRAFGTPLVLLASYTLIHGMAFAITRFRLPLEGLLAVLAAYGLSRGWQACVAAKRFR